MKDIKVFKDISQNSDEWYRIRLGIPTCSEFKRMMVKGSGGGLGKGAVTYMFELIGEVLTGKPARDLDGAKIRALEWGHEHEGSARALYQMETGCRLEQVGFVKRAIGSGLVLGGSPDGFCEDSTEDGPGGLELKCPLLSSNHLRWMSDGGVPSDHYCQVQGLMWLTGRSWWDFASFDPRMPDAHKLYVHREYADAEFHKDLDRRAKQFCEQIQVRLGKIRSRLIAA